MTVRITLYEKKNDNVPKYKRTTWEELVEACRTHDRRESKDGLLWSPGEIEDGLLRASENVVAIHFMVADIDDVPDEKVEELKEKLAGLDCFVVSTHGHKVEKIGKKYRLFEGEPPPRTKARVVVRTTRSWTREEHPAVWQFFVDSIDVPQTDESCKDPSRMYYTPSALPGAPTFFWRGEGEPLDVDEVLRLAPPTRRRAPRASKRGDGAPRGRARRKHGVGGRNQLIFDSALRLRRLGMSYEQVLPEMLSVNTELCDPPLDHDEVAETTRKACSYEVSRRHYPSTEIGNAQRLRDRYGDRFRWVEAWRKWLVFDERRWRVEGSDTAMQRFVKRVVQEEIVKEAQETEDPEARKALLSWAKASASRSKVSGTIELAKSEPGVSASHELFDQEPFLLNCENGVLDLRTLELRAHDPALMLTQLAAAPWVPGASEGSEWERFVVDICSGDEELVTYLRRVVGYCATGSVAEHALFFFYGRGSNGKGTFVEAVLGALGQDYSAPGPHGLLLSTKNGEKHPTGIASLYAKRFVTLQEVDDSRPWDEPLIKQLTGGDRISSRRLYEDFWSFSPTHKFVVTGNGKPVVKDTTDGMWRRLRLVPFKRQFLDDQGDNDLVARVKADRVAVLDWIVRGAAEWLERGLDEPDSVRQATQRYRDEQDEVGLWLDETCEVSPESRCSRSQANTSYQQWCTANGQVFTLDPKKLKSKLEERGFRQVKIGDSRERGWEGFRPRRPTHLTLVSGARP